MAHANRAPGRIYVNRGDVLDCGRNRSEAAYLCNPQAERDQWGADTDREMLLLKFVKLDGSGREWPVGALNGYPVHPTDRGQKNTLVCGDNKDYASSLFERQMGSNASQPETFVAAFANANCGDVSGNVELGHIPDGVHDRALMEKHGCQQFEAAERLFQTATEEVTGPVDHRHTRLDLSNVVTGTGGARTWPAALGISFAAGSSEDSVPVPDLGIREKITAANITVTDAVLASAAGLGLSVIFGVPVIDQGTAISEREGHLPKPAVLMPGLEQPPAVPQVLPVQLLRVGTVAILGIPGELTTMAGRRLRTTVLGAISATGVKHVALGTYANEYSQYVTTLEEYSSQQYEGVNAIRPPSAGGLPAHRRWTRDGNRRGYAVASRPFPQRVDCPSAAPVPLPEPVELGSRALVLQHRRLVALAHAPQWTEDDRRRCGGRVPGAGVHRTAAADDRQAQGVGERRYPADDVRRSAADDLGRRLGVRGSVHPSGTAVTREDQPPPRAQPGAGQCADSRILSSTGLWLAATTLGPFVPCEIVTSTC